MITHRWTVQAMNNYPELGTLKHRDHLVHHLCASLKVTADTPVLPQWKYNVQAMFQAVETVRSAHGAAGSAVGAAGSAVGAGASEAGAAKTAADSAVEAPGAGGVPEAGIQKFCKVLVL